MVDGKLGRPSTTCVVDRRVVVDGCPIRWCQSSSCFSACNAFDVHVVVREDTRVGVPATGVLFGVVLVSCCMTDDTTGGVTHC